MTSRFWTSSGAIGATRSRPRILQPQPPADPRSIAGQAVAREPARLHCRRKLGRRARLPAVVMGIGPPAVIERAGALEVVAAERARGTQPGRQQRSGENRPGHARHAADCVTSADAIRPPPRSKGVGNSDTPGDRAPPLPQEPTRSSFPFGRVNSGNRPRPSTTAIRSFPRPSQVIDAKRAGFPKWKRRKWRFSGKFGLIS
jgi:hypothetical protein